MSSLRLRVKRKPTDFVALIKVEAFLMFMPSYPEAATILDNYIRIAHIFFSNQWIFVNNIDTTFLTHAHTQFKYYTTIQHKF